MLSYHLYLSDIFLLLLQILYVKHLVSQKERFIFLEEILLTNQSKYKEICMKIIDLKEHNKKISKQTKRILKGTYPTPKIAKIGSFVGLMIGVLLSLFGGIDFLLGSIWGISSLLSGVMTIVSNLLHLNRIK